MTSATETHETNRIAEEDEDSAGDEENEDAEEDDWEREIESELESDSETEIEENETTEAEREAERNRLLAMEKAREEREKSGEREFESGDDVVLDSLKHVPKFTCLYQPPGSATPALGGRFS